MTAGTVLVYWLLCFPMAIEAGCMTGRRVLESCPIGNQRVRPTSGRRHRRSGAWGMTNLAGAMSRKVGDVGKVSYFFPVAGRYLVTSIAGAAMFGVGVRESRIIDRLFPGNLLACRFANPALLCGNATTT